MSNSKGDNPDSYEGIVQELRQDFKEVFERSVCKVKGARMIKLYKEKKSFFDYALNKIVQERAADVVQKYYRSIKEQLCPEKENDPIMKDLKLRQLRLALFGPQGMELQVLQSFIEKKNQLFEKIIQDLERSTDPGKMFEYYFKDDTFAVERTRRSMILMGKEESEINSEIARVKDMFDQSKEVEFAVKMVLAPCGTLQGIHKIARLFSRIFRAKFMQFGYTHAALQIGPYLIGWFDDSIVHIDVITSSKAMLLLYPNQNTKQCRLARPTGGCFSFLGQICETITTWNLNMRYNSILANCQIFFSQVVKHTGVDEDYNDNPTTNYYVRQLLDGKISLAKPFVFWTRHQELAPANQYQQHEFNNYDDFVEWCKEHLPTSYDKLHNAAYRDVYHVCLSIERSYMLRQGSAGIPLSRKPYFDPNGNVTQYGLTSCWFV